MAAASLAALGVVLLTSGIEAEALYTDAAPRFGVTGGSGSGTWSVKVAALSVLCLVSLVRLAHVGLLLLLTIRPSFASTCRAYAPLPTGDHESSTTCAYADDKAASAEDGEGAPASEEGGEEAILLEGNGDEDREKHRGDIAVFVCTDTVSLGELPTPPPEEGGHMVHSV